MTELIRERLIALDGMSLERGCHFPLYSDADPDGESLPPMCLLEAAAWVAGEEWTDRPACVSPVLAGLGRKLNDVLPDRKRQLLKPFVGLLPGTASDGLDETRAYLALDWLIRTHTPTWLDLARLTVEATALADLPRIVDMPSAKAAAPAVRAARDQAYAARYAAEDNSESWDVAWDVSRSAAAKSAWGAARFAARPAGKWAAGVWTDPQAAAGASEDAIKVTAMRVISRSARACRSRAAAETAALAELRPTIDLLQDSAIELFTRMITPDAA
jgi:hypothetical protein